MSANVALSLMARAALTIATGTPLLLTAGAELPITIFIGRNGFITSTQGGSPAFSGAVGYRLGVTF